MASRIPEACTALEEPSVDLSRAVSSALAALALGVPFLAPAAANPKAHAGAPVPSVSSTASVLPANKPAVMPFGSYCLTPLGRVGPVLAAPVGSPCSGPSAQGSIAGQTVQ